MADIFLSYNEKDRDTVRRLAETLQSVGWSVWWDRHVPAGATWRALLERELQSMRCMVVVWSSNSIRSEWVCEEATEGRERGCLVPVRIEAVKPPAGFREIQAADLVGWDGTATARGMRTMIEDIEQRLGKPQALVQAPDDRDRAAAARTTTAATAVTATPGRRLPLAAAAAALVVVAIAGGLYAGQRREAPSDDAGRVAATDAAGPAATSTTAVATPSPPATTPSNDPATVTLEHARPIPTPKEPEATSPKIVAAAPVNRGPSVSPAHRARCTELLQRFSLGESLSAESQSFLRQRCGQ